MVTAVKYSSHLVLMEHWLTEAGLAFDSSSPKEVDTTLARYPDFLSCMGKSTPRGSTPWQRHYTDGFIWPKPARLLPLARQGLRSWKKMCPGKSRFPIPWLWGQQLRL